MTDDDFSFFLILKFSNLDNALRAFRNAINSPQYLTEQYNIPVQKVMKVLRIWIEEGMPAHLPITKDNVDAILCAKFGTIENAYQYWVYHEIPHMTCFTEVELKRIVDHIPQPKA